MLVESLDNANDIEPLKLWPDIVKNLTNSESELVVQCLWVCGTAIQVGLLVSSPCECVTTLACRTTQSRKKKSAPSVILDQADL
jgi:hypothetical protein